MAEERHRITWAMVVENQWDQYPLVHNVPEYAPDVHTVIACRDGTYILELARGVWAGHQRGYVNYLLYDGNKWRGHKFEEEPDLGQIPPTELIDFDADDIEIIRMIISDIENEQTG